MVLIRNVPCQSWKVACVKRTIGRLSDKHGDESILHGQEQVVLHFQILTSTAVEVRN